MVNARPRLNSYQRELARHRVQVEGWSVIATAHAAGVSRQTVHKWLRRFEHEGPAGLADRSSRPQRMPRLTRIDLAVRICSERLARKVGPHELALLLGIARSTIYAVLRRAELNRLGALVAKLRVQRYEWPAPGDLVHLDIKRFGRIPEDGGWRNLGRTLANAVKRQAGYEYCHVALDDHSRLPDAVLLGDQRSASAVAALEQVWGRYLRAGVRIKRIRTDNGSCYRSLDFRAACDRLGIIHWRTRPYTPRTNGKAERFIKTLQERWAYARLYRSSAERAAALPDFLSEYRHRRSPTLDGHT
ncbi:MAG TPA: IS481 family transposase, partial [Candidatus Limnocylindria bacterium]|nr:IS481 family transposase [Candidatus Limnocylindria bacterium]